MANINVVPNRLINEKSPYLLQHAHNPVDWYPWGEEAFNKAKAEDKPIFLSIGYSTCHWCHVMERESFEDSEVADILNRNFISVKVDREERPDIDHIYMEVCQMLTGHGGWPLTIIMTPNAKPFYAGTYFPKNSRMGLPGLVNILETAATVWKEQKESLLETGNEIADALNKANEPISEIVYSKLADMAYEQFKANFDNQFGGFYQAPKFPTPHNLLFLLRYWYKTGERYALDMVEKTLDCMYRGGMFDHIGFGFSRYSTDNKWLIPHFEKMLYDNALLAIAYIEAYQSTKKRKYATIAEQIFTYVLKTMTSDEGAFLSAEDADSEGEEGKFYAWTKKEIQEILGPEDAEEFCSYYNITAEGNFEGKSIPNLIGTQTTLFDENKIESCRKQVFEVREKRVHPYKDDKVLTSLNGLMIAAMAIGARTLNNDAYAETAEKAANFVLSKLVRKDGRLMARYREGEVAHLGYVNDYTFLIWGLLELYETTYKAQYLSKALKLNTDMLNYFWDDQNGGLFLYGSDSEQLITSPKEIYDGAMPSGNSVATLNFLRLAQLTGMYELEDRAKQQFSVFSSIVERSPASYSFFLTALLFSQSDVKNVVIFAGENKSYTEEMVKVLREEFRPFVVSVLHDDEHDNIKEIIPFISNYKAIDGETTGYLCENFSCKEPMTDLNDFRRILE